MRPYNLKILDPPLYYLFTYIFVYDVLFMQGKHTHSMIGARSSNLSI